MDRRALAAAFFTLAFVSAEAHMAPVCSGERKAEISSLSPDDVKGHLAGHGMGLARAAEMNGYPGPLHVLELAKELSLSPPQKKLTEELVAATKAKAIDAGRALVEAERALDELFCTRKATQENVADAVARIGQRQAEVRRVHLAAHIRQVEILSPPQVLRYYELRKQPDLVKAMSHGEGTKH
jgi:hypothetical protein